jgi:dienelactone hydrolase
MRNSLETRSSGVPIDCSDGKQTVAQLSTPTDVSEGKLPGLIVIHEVYGLNNQIRGVAKRYAEQGHVVLAPNLFSRFDEIMSEKNIEARCVLFGRSRRRKVLIRFCQNLVNASWERFSLVIIICLFY